MKKLLKRARVRGGKDRGQRHTRPPDHAGERGAACAVRVHFPDLCGGRWETSDIPKLLGGLRDVYLNVELREAVFRLLEERIGGAPG